MLSAAMAAIIRLDIRTLPSIFLVGAPRFELGTPSPPDWCANRAALRSAVSLRADDLRRRGGSCKGFRAAAAGDASAAGGAHSEPPLPNPAGDRVSARCRHQAPQPGAHA